VGTGFAWIARNLLMWRMILSANRFPLRRIMRGFLSTSVHTRHASQLPRLPENARPL
jgi:hypothetical protein